MRRRDLVADPLVQFRHWFNQASGSRASGRIWRFLVGMYKAFLALGGVEPADVNAMTLATVDQSGKVSARVVLLKGADERGFVFFTNYQSRKGQELGGHPQAALVFYWADLERQVCVSGEVERLSAEESDSYFRGRPRGSQIGAWASNQSQKVRDREELEQQWKQKEAEFGGKPVPRPPHWGGYLLKPARIEFWQGRPSRLHDRFCYEREADGTWVIARLSP